MVAPADRDHGVVTSVEMMYLLIASLVAVLFIGYLGRLHAAGIEVTTTAQSAARSASQARTSSEGLRVARAIAVAGPLTTRCVGGPALVLRWQRSAVGTWHGGSVTVEVRCTIRNARLTGVWAPGVRTVVVSDTQPVDTYRR